MSAATICATRCSCGARPWRRRATSSGWTAGERRACACILVAGVERRLDLLHEGADAADAGAVDLGAAVVAADALLCLRRVRHLKTASISEMKRARPCAAPAQAPPSTSRGAGRRSTASGTLAARADRRSSGPNRRAGESSRAARAGLALAAIDAPLLREIAELAVGPGIVAQRRAAGGDRGVEHRFGPPRPADRAGRAKSARRPGRARSRRCSAPRRHRCCRGRRRSAGRAAAP